MPSKFKSENIDILFSAILSLTNVSECYDFFEDLCTISEIKEMGQRFEVARLLNDKKIYTEIVKQTGASSATVSRVNKCLTYGTGGYQKALEKLSSK